MEHLMSRRVLTWHHDVLRQGETARLSELAVRLADVEDVLEGIPTHACREVGKIATFLTEGADEAPTAVVHADVAL